MAGIPSQRGGRSPHFFRCHPNIFLSLGLCLTLALTSGQSFAAEEKGSNDKAAKQSSVKAGEKPADSQNAARSSEKLPGIDKNSGLEKKKEGVPAAGQPEKKEEAAKAPANPEGENAKPKPEPKTDVLSLLDEGKISIKLQAEGAYKLHVKIRNESNETVKVKFPPGLVADAFAQNQLFRQVASVESGQGMGLLNTPDSSIAVGEVASFDIRSCCLNYGVPEPKKHTPLFLKTVQDYTPNPEVHRVLKQVAANATPTPVAQAALWHYTNNLSWDKLARVGPGVGLFLTPDQMKEVKFISGESSTSLNTDVTFLPPQKVEKLPEEKLKPFAIAINPDPRSIQPSSTAVRQMAHLLRQLSPGIDITYRNFSSAPAKQETPVVQWHVLVKAFDTTMSGTKKPSLFTIQRSEWDPKTAQWRFEKPFVAKTPKVAQDETPTTLCKRLMADIAERSLQVTYNRTKGEIKVVNLLPVEVTALTLRAKKTDDSTIVLKDVSIPTGAKGAIIRLTPADQEKLATTVKPAACGFDIRS